MSRPPERPQRIATRPGRYGWRCLVGDCKKKGSAPSPDTAASELSEHYDSHHESDRPR